MIVVDWDKEILFFMEGFLEEDLFLEIVVVEECVFEGYGLEVIFIGVMGFFG